MSVLAIPEEFRYKLKKDIRKTRPLTKDEIQELQRLLDQTVHDFVGLEPKVREWDRWLVFVLRGLEMEVGSNPEQVEEFEGMVERLRGELGDWLRLGEW
jgi:hypothetical protein